MKRYIMECLGTMFLVLAISLTGNPIAIGAMLTALVYMGGHVSGGYYNPAVTLAVFMRGSLKVKDFWFYMFFQILGGFFAAGLYFLLAGQRYFPVPAAGVTLWKIFGVELLFTFVLAYTVLTVMTTKKLKNNYIYGLAIGFALMTIAFLGGTYNPAVSLGPVAFDAIFKGTSYLDMPIYVLGAFTGGGFAALAYRYFNCEEFKTKTKRVVKKK